MLKGLLDTGVYHGWMQASGQKHTLCRTQPCTKRADAVRKAERSRAIVHTKFKCLPLPWNYVHKPEMILLQWSNKHAIGG